MRHYINYLTNEAWGEVSRGFIWFYFDLVSSDILNFDLLDRIAAILEQKIY